ncbi:hypothetical protein [Actinomadura sp. NEAU-AAG7]|uniref:hypothetical protein n=1 Tax=Actinomadura sp. NEAU-AAG7 TaxID=2839640 RepID=UPI001BE47F20|nr:hypothetical protein [Actinomadura sp. NEAU-AAG7]MBT2211394.1 hypothetical protein [Actinomadura sp. NEAU-AAG7]
MTQEAPEPPPEQEGVGPGVLRWLAGLIANVTVLTALLVYFGWQRNYVMADRVGIEESVLGQSVRDYLLRSVRPALVLLLLVAVCGLVWLQVDRVLAPRVRDRGTRDRLVRRALGFLSVSWLALPLAVYALGFTARALALDGGREFAYVAWPLSIGAGLLLTFYGTQLRGTSPADKEPLLRAFVAVAVVVMLFWGTSNYATLQGNALADKLITGIHRQNEVTVYSPKRLFLAAPGVTETELPGKNAAYGYRYGGLRLLAHAGGHYFLVSDSWAPGGAVMVLSEKDNLRLEFSRT